MSAMGRERTLYQPHRPHARSAVRADDHMVVHRHLHVPSGLDQVAGQADILLARAGIAARVIVDDDDGRRAERDGARDHFADMHRRLVDRALPQRFVGDQHVLGVDAEYVDRIPMKSMT